eukprot:scaffold134871_cov112-Phaeocystis_antarctica.AAC.1
MRLPKKATPSGVRSASRAPLAGSLWSHGRGSLSQLRPGRSRASRWPVYASFRGAGLSGAAAATAGAGRPQRPS